MASLSAFLKPTYTEKKIEVIVGDRFKDEDGNPVAIVMKSLTQSQMQAISKQSTKEKKVNGKVVRDIDMNEHLNRCLVESIVFPDMRSKELCEAYGTLDPVTLPSRMFLIGEYQKLAQAFAELNGLDSEDDLEDTTDEITKNL